ncbi:DUF1643 domain-containing protein [Priestia megaterium]|uniref:DUF1643 domain-containing protein n=1 Tax=Priestia megaterium TaxID=1404 RepID=UPI0032E3CD6C
MTHSILIKRNVIETEAVFSECGSYRYLLSRSIQGKPRKMTFIMFNPNVRDDIQLGPTSNYCFNYAINKGYGKVEIVNLFALRTRNIKELKQRVKSEEIDPIGGLNDNYITNSIKDADKVIIAWGSEGGFKRRDSQVLKLLKGTNIYCFGKSKKNKPVYPKREKNTKLMSLI